MQLSDVQESIKHLKLESARGHAECGDLLKFITDSNKREIGSVFEVDRSKKHEQLSSSKTRK